MGTKKKVRYIKSSKGYVITTKDDQVVKELQDEGYTVKYSNDGYTLIVKELPNSSFLSFQRHQTKAPKPNNKEELEEEYEKLLKLEEEMDKLHDKLEEQEAKVIKKLEKIGLKLKPSLPKDSQLYLDKFKTRLHSCYSVRRYPLEDEIRKQEKKYPALSRCFSLKNIVIDYSELSKKEEKTINDIIKKHGFYCGERFNESVFNQLKESLPSGVLKKIIKTDIFPNFRQLELKNPQCNHCGGRVKKDRVCTHCGLTSLDGGR